MSNAEEFQHKAEGAEVLGEASSSSLVQLSVASMSDAARGGKARGTHKRLRKEHELPPKPPSALEKALER